MLVSKSRVPALLQIHKVNAASHSFARMGGTDFAVSLLFKSIVLMLISRFAKREMLFNKNFFHMQITRLYIDVLEALVKSTLCGTLIKLGSFFLSKYLFDQLILLLCTT